MVAHEDVRVAIHRGRHVSPTVTSRYTVERECLYDKIDALLPDPGPTRIVSIAAPAGSGKTVLLSRWCQRLHAAGGWSVAWITVDDSDNDVEVLFTAVVAALAAATGDPVLASGAEALLASPGFCRSSTDTSALISDLLDHSSRVCLVMDDAHLLHDARAIEQLARLFRWAPMSCRLILAGRFEPPLLLTRCRVEGSVTEIVPRQMNMTTTEARELLSRRSFEVDDNVLTALMIKTEGWAAGLQLAALTA
ncbi:MAG: AAA family ATPase, partial [Rhodococcus sp. (in: high G+C Gram-positive bacteria)]